MPGKTDLNFKHLFFEIDFGSDQVKRCNANRLAHDSILDGHIAIESAAS